jgi:outer membrane lipoprotein-sorting protein
VKLALRAAVAAVLAIAGQVAFAQQDPQKALQQVQNAVQNVKSYQALLEVRDQQGKDEMVASSTLTVSREHGWRIEENSSEGNHYVVNDFTTSYEYFPNHKKAIKFVAENAETREGFRKPANEMNPLVVLDQSSVKLIGEENLDGEPVFHFEGTTSTQFMAQGKPVTRKIEAWVSTKDGLPRKTIEHSENTVGTTVYKNVKTNIEVKPEMFKFTPPEGVEVVDMNVEMRKQRENERVGRRPAGGPAGEGGSRQTPGAKATTGVRQ